MRWYNLSLIAGKRTHKYKCLGFYIDLKQGVISKNGKNQAVRAKTLQVLIMLIQHADEVVSKKRLLDIIWHDVVVQEQVLTQSIKELRDVLGSQVIKTFPKDGYQWVAPITAINTRNRIAVFIGAIIGIGLLLTLIISVNSKQQGNAFSIAFLPVENDISDNIHQWVPLRGMEYLSRQLKANTDLTVIGHDQVLYVLEHRSEYGMQSLDANKLAFLRQKLEATVLVYTRLTGYPQDFQLHYTLFFEYGIEKGVEFAKSIEQSFEQLNVTLAHKYASQRHANVQNWDSDFSNEAFARGVELYLKQAYQQAVPLFLAALQTEPNLLAARRYLAASYANQGLHSKAITLLMTTVEQSGAFDNRELIRAHLMIGYLLINWPQGKARIMELSDAQFYIEKAQTLAQTQQDELFIAYTYEELGKIKRLQGDFQQATKLVTKALEYHQSFYSQYGQTAALIELARIAAQQQQFGVAGAYLEQAQKIADDHAAPANQVWVLLAKADIAKQQNKLTEAEQLALSAQQVARYSDKPHLITRVAAWFNDQSPYTVN